MVYVTFLCVQLVCILLSDCDLILKFYEHWGKRPEAAHVEALTGFDDGCLSVLAGNCRLIARLTLKTLPKLHGTCLEKLAEMCSQLEHLNVCVAV